MDKTKLDYIVFKCLDMELDGTEETKGKHVDIVFIHPGEKYGIIGIEKTDDEGDEGNNVFVCHGLSDKIIGLFSMDRFDALEVIGRYVENRLKLKVDYTHHIGSAIHVDNGFNNILEIDTI